MRKGLKQEINAMINKEIKSVREVKFYEGGGNYYYRYVDLHELIHAVLNHCRLDARYTAPEPRKLVVKETKKGTPKKSRVGEG